MGDLGGNLNDLFGSKGRREGDVIAYLDSDPALSAAQTVIAELLSGFPRLAGLWILANQIGWTAGNYAEDVAPYGDETREDDAHREDEVALFGGIEHKAGGILRDITQRLSEAPDYPAPGREFTPQEIAELSRLAFGKGGA